MNQQKITWPRKTTNSLLWQSTWLNLAIFPLGRHRWIPWTKDEGGDYFRWFCSYILNEIFFFSSVYKFQYIHIFKRRMRLTSSYVSRDIFLSIQYWLLRYHSVLLEEQMWRSIFDCKVICELWKKRGEILHSSFKTHRRLHSIDLFINLKGFEVT